MIDQRLASLIDVFKCCIFNWGALTVILPAFAIAGAIIAFVPSWQVTKYLGKKSKRYISYPAAAVSGAILPACSCNIIPLFAGILERGAGLGPAFTFLYAGPAINIISLILTFKVFGPLLGIWRIIGVLLISIFVGRLMEFLFSKSEEKNAAVASINPQPVQSNNSRLLMLFSLLLILLISGSSLTISSAAIDNVGWLYAKIFAFFISAGLLLLLIITKFSKLEMLDWLTQTVKLLKQIIPLFLVSILIIGFITQYIDLGWMKNLFLVAKDSLGKASFLATFKATFFAGIFSELMYFPILSEIAFVKAFFKLGIDMGPGMIILLAGPGTSLPGFILLSKFLSWKKVAAFFAISLTLEVIFVTVLAMLGGKALCSCNFAQ